MATKFSDFTAQAATGTTFVVGYDGTTNTQYSQDNLTNFVLDGTLSSPRTLKLNSNTLTISSASGFPLINTAKFSIYPNGNSNATSTRAVFSSGNIDFNYLGHNSNSIGLNFSSYNTSIRAYGFSFYGGGGFSTNSGYSVIGPNFSYTSGNALSARLGVIGKGNTASSYGLRVQNVDGDDIVKVFDDQTIGLGYNATQITTDSTTGGHVWLRNVTGSPLFSAGIVSGSTAKINVYGGGYNSFEYAASKGLVFTNQAGIHVSQDLSSMLTCVSSTKGFLPPRMTTTQRDAINSGTFTTGLTLYNTTDNELQFYNGTSWNSAGGGDSIYTADGIIAGNRLVTLPTSGGLSFRVKNIASSKVNIGYESGYGSISINPARPIIGSAHRIEAGGVAMLSKYTAGNTLWFGNENATNNSYGFNMGAAPNGSSTVAFTIKGQGATSSTTSLLVKNFNGNDLLSIKDNGDYAVKNPAGVDRLTINSDGSAGLSILKTKNYTIKNTAGGTINTLNANNNGCIETWYFGGFQKAQLNANSGQFGVSDVGITSGMTDGSALITMRSTTKGLLPPRMTNTQRDAISSPTAGLMLYSSTDSKIQFYDGSAWTDAGGGADTNIYNTDGDILATRTINDRAGGFTGTAGNNALKMNVRNSGALMVAGYQNNGDPGTTNNCVRWGPGTTAGGMNVKGNLGLASGGGSINLTSSGGQQFFGISQNGTSIDTPVGISRAQSASVSMYIQGQGATSGTRSLLLENGNGGYMMSVKDDGQITIGSSAIIQSTSNPQYSIVIGNQAKDIASAGNAAESVAIGRLAAGNNGSVAIGGQAKGLGSSSVAVGAQAQAKATGVSVGFQAGGASAGSSAVSIGKFAQAKATGSIAIGTNTGLTGANSIVLNATAGVTSTTTTDTFDVFMTSTSTPDLKFRTGDNQSYWNPAGETSAFGFSTTSPTATVDINGTFRLRAATNVSNQILTADSNGNATWSDSLNLNGQVKGGYESGVTTLAFDWDNGNIQKSSATGAQTFSGSNAIAGSTYIIMIGTPTVTWGSSVKWPGATAPTLAGTTNIITLLYDGTSYYATSVLNYS